MIELARYRGKSVAIYGLSSTGLSAAMALRMSGAETCFWDESEAVRDHVERIGLGVCVHPSEWPWADLCVVVPGMDRRRPFRADHPIVTAARSHNIPVKSDVALFAEYLNDSPTAMRPQVIGIGGSGGKSTTAAFLAAMLHAAGRRVCLASDTGKPVLSFNHDSPDMYFILELPARVLAYTQALSCNCVIYLNTWHIDTKTFTNAREHVDAVSGIFNNQDTANTAIIGVDDSIGEKICSALIEQGRADEAAPAIVPIASRRHLRTGVFCTNGQLYWGRHGKVSAIMSLDTIPALLGDHLYQDLVAALAACLHFDININDIAPAIAALTPLPKRMECLGARDGVVFVDDSLATAISATGNAIGAFQDAFWVGGGRNIRQDLAILMSSIDCVSHAYLFGPAAIQLTKEIGDRVSVNVYTSSYEAITHAVNDATQFAQKNRTAVPTVLYSPGYPPDLAAHKTMGFSEILTPHIMKGAA